MIRTWGALFFGVRLNRMFCSLKTRKNIRLLITIYYNYNGYCSRKDGNRKHDVLVLSY